MHGVCSWAVQSQLYHSMRAVSCRISDRHAGISGRNCMHHMWCRSFQLSIHRGVRGLHSGAVPGQYRAVQLLDMPRWLCHRYTGWERRCELHSVCGGSIQLYSYVSVCTMRSGLRDRCRGKLRRCELHGVRGGAVQLCVDIGVHGMCAGVGDRHVGKRGGDHVQCLRGGTVQCGVDAGVCRLCGGAVPGSCGAVAMLGVRGWLGDGHVGVCGCCELHGVCGG
jgi:hypothetical protein